jgi:hypothetical protein
MGNVSDLPVSFYTVELASLRDCALTTGRRTPRTTWCANFTDYRGDALLRRVREHRVGADLTVATEDQEPTHVLQTFTAVPARQGPANQARCARHAGRGSPSN